MAVSHWRKVGCKGPRHRRQVVFFSNVRTNQAAFRDPAQAMRDSAGVPPSLLEIYPGHPLLFLKRSGNNIPQ